MSESEQQAQVLDPEEVPLRMRGQPFALLTLEVHDPADPSFDEALRNKVAQAPGFFAAAPVVLDFGPCKLDLAEIDPADVAERVRASGLVPVGVQATDVDVARRGVAAGLARITPGDPRDARLLLTERPGWRPTRIVQEPVRSGQSIYAANSDLIVLSSVSHGAEVLADGNIIVFGTLRGRALAGVNDNTEARILTGSMDAELLSVAGLYLAAEDFPPEWRHQRAQILLRGGFLRFAPLP